LATGSLSVTITVPVTNANDPNSAGRAIANTLLGIGFRYSRTRGLQRSSDGTCSAMLNKRQPVSVTITDDRSSGYPAKR
jgi:hypothetical protein